MNKIPCKDCLILPACKGKSKTMNVTSCSLLSRWWYRREARYQYRQDLEEIKRYLDIPDTDDFTKDVAKWT